MAKKKTTKKQTPKSKAKKSAPAKKSKASVFLIAPYACGTCGEILSMGHPILTPDGERVYDVSCHICHEGYRIPVTTVTVTKIPYVAP